MQPVQERKSAVPRTIDEAEFENLRTTLSCPYSLEPMKKAVVFLQCSHAMDEPSALQLRSFSLKGEGKEEKFDDDGHRVKFVTPISCPMCRASVTEYVRCKTLESICEDIDKAFKPLKKVKQEVTDETSRNLGLGIIAIGAAIVPYFTYHTFPKKVQQSWFGDPYYTVDKDARSAHTMVFTIIGVISAVVVILGVLMCQSSTRKTKKYIKES